MVRTISEQATTGQPTETGNPTCAHSTMNDWSNAIRLAKQFGDRILLVKDTQDLYVWDGSRWRRDLGDAQVTRWAAATMEALAQPAAATGQSDLQRWADRSLHGSRLKSMVQLVRMVEEIRGAMMDELDAKPHLLNVTNGTIDLRTGALRKHDPDDLITRIVPQPYDPDASCPRFDRFIDEVMRGDSVMTEFLHRYAGMLCTGEVRDQLFFVHYGSGRNGKSVFFEVLMKVLGEDYASPAPPNMLLAKQFESHPTEIMELRGRRLIVAAETDRSSTLSMGRVKAWTGADRIKGRRMRQDFVSFAPTHKLILMTNHKPLINDDSDGAWRRVRLMPWEFTVSQPNPNLCRELVDKEAQGILAWLVAGARRYYDAGKLDVPQAILQQTEAYRNQQNPLSDFIDDECEIHRHAKPGHKLSTTSVGDFVIPVSQLYAAYSRWCDTQKMTGKQRLDKIAFNDALESNYGVHRQSHRGPHSDGKSVKHWIGIRRSSGGMAFQTTPSHVEQFGQAAPPIRVQNPVHLNLTPGGPAC